ncbi:MAG: PKD domain-containing protein, partial [Thermoplasmata archaeon]
EEGPPQNQPPVAMAEPPIQMIYVGEEAWFSGNCSYDPDGYIVSYHWDFGDGTSGNGEWVTHIYNYPGNYTVTLTVTDDDGATDSHEVIVIVEEGDPPPENLPPVAMAEPPVQIVYVGEEAWFSGNCSYDPDGYIVTYHWNFGDGISKGGVTVKHVYHYPGNYTVSLTVTDDDGATDCDTVMVIVRKLQEDNWSPVADAGSDRFAHPYEELIFNGNGSFDLDGTIVSYEWDFGDGFTAKGMMVTHSYSEHRTYIVTLFVVDDEGATDTETCIVFVTNMLPIVYIEEESETYFMGEQVQFAGNSSYDPDGYIVSYEWDFGDGSYHSGITASHIFTSPGAFCVTLTVCDNNDGTNKNSVIIEISEKENNPWQPPEPEIPAPWPKKVRNPVLILTAGLINIATFNEESERVVPVEVAAYYGDVHNVHIELIDDGGLDIEIIPIVQDVPDGKIVRFYLVIKDPESSDEVESKGITIKLKAVGDETESNLEYVDVIIIDKIKENPMISEVEVVSAAGTLTIASILAILIKRRIF